MSFTLVVHFTGLCLHVRHPTEPAVAVLMPDGRYVGDIKKHPDDTLAVPHVGYIRMDLANILRPSSGATLPQGERNGRIQATDGPFFETLYRIGDTTNPLGGGETLDFGLPKDDEIEGSTTLPDLDVIAPGIPLRPGLFTKLAGAIPGPTAATTTRSPLLFRTLLYGGTWETGKGIEDEHWAIDLRLNQTPASPMVASFAGETTWTRTVTDRERLTLSLTSFDGTNEKKIPLTPVDGVVRLKIANLCSENPIEWDEFLIRTAGMEDSDFKWFYQLLEPPGANPTPQNWMPRWRACLDNKLLPAPRLIGQLPQLSGRPPYDCAEAAISFSFPSFDTWSQ